MKEHPETTRTEAFRAVAAMWKDDPSNPKNAPKPPEKPVAQEGAAAGAGEPMCLKTNPWAMNKQEEGDAVAVDSSAAGEAGQDEKAEKDGEDDDSGDEDEFEVEKVSKPCSFFVRSG